MKIRILISVCLMLICFSGSTYAQSSCQNKTSYVNPFIGTGAVDAQSLSGSNFPGATTPFGMVQLSPDTRDVPEFPASGYDYKDKTIIGFSHTHLNGTGIGDLFDVLVMPFTGEIKATKGIENPYHSAFSHENETASPGYYQVLLTDYGINAELTATEHAGFHRYSFPESNSAHILIDLDHSVNKNARWNPVTIFSSQIKIIDNQTIEGFRILSGWGEGVRRVYFRAVFSKPFSEYLLQNGHQLYHKAQSVNGNSVKAFLSFNTTKDEQILVKVGISTVSCENAALNSNQEIPDWNFDKIRKKTEDQWENELEKIDVEGTKEQKEIFYTAMYHAFIQPNNLADVNGDYLAVDGTQRNAPDKKHYSTFSLWDTYRAANPLYTFTQPERTAGFISSMLRQYNSFGFLPIWQLWGLENYCMIGNHAVPIVVDAVLKGIDGIDAEKAYEAVKGTLTHDHPEFSCTVWDQYGYVPQDISSESVSFTLEMAYDDWCAAQLAKKLNKNDDYEFFMKRSANFKNLYDKNTQFFRAKDKAGNWVEPFNPLSYSYDEHAFYTEGNAWHYLFYAPQDVEGLTTLFGGKEVLASKLDTFFTMRIDQNEKDGNVSGLIGQYAHGNEPSHHVAYLYNYLGQPWKTQKYVAQILRELYNNTSSGYSGNDDCGQMSAWYIFSAMGFYPVNPANGVFVIGSPVLKSAEIKLQNGKLFKTLVKNADNQNIYIQSMKLNDKSYSKMYITYDDIRNGGLLEFDMGNKINKHLGITANDIPPAFAF
jgi:predicted alpha-1,2-mannosidase